MEDEVGHGGGLGGGQGVYAKCLTGQGAIDKAKINLVLTDKTWEKAEIK